MASEFYMTVEGTTQGKFPGTSMQKGHAGEITGLAWRYSIRSPRDMATGQTSGKRQHQPIVVITERSSVSPMFLQALCTNEILKFVNLSFFKADPNGVQVNYYTIKMTNATVASVFQHGSSIATSTNFEGPNLPEMDEIEFTFDKIEWNFKTTATVNTASGITVTMDDWA